VGNGKLETQLKRNSEQDENITFLPFQNQKRMPIVYRLADVFVLPSQGPGETWGLAVNEAMACGRPVLVSDRAGCAVDLVTDGVNGYIFKSNDMKDLIDKLRFLIKSDLNKMGQKSRQMIQNWSFEKICNALEKEI
jgi:glycosyltransferase involved in cell wall biosynthesis